MIYMEGEKLHNQYEEDRAFILERVDVLLNRWGEYPHDRISEGDYNFGISLERQRNKYRHAWFEAIGELVAIIDEQGIGPIAERQKIKNIVTALNYKVSESRKGTRSDYVAIGNQLLRRIIDMLEK